jgi:hypothetical protein
MKNKLRAIVALLKEQSVFGQTIRGDRADPYAA